MNAKWCSHIPLEGRDSPDGNPYYTRLIIENDGAVAVANFKGDSWSLLSESDCKSKEEFVELFEDWDLRTVHSVAASMERDGYVEQANCVRAWASKLIDDRAVVRTARHTNTHPKIVFAAK
jgi:hypothetical protein